METWCKERLLLYLGSLVLQKTNKPIYAAWFFFLRSYAEIFTEPNASYNKA